VDTLDVSRGGMRIRTGHNLQDSHRVVLGLRSRFLRRIVRFEGQVVWTNRVDEDNSKYTIAGIRVLSTSHEGTLMLHRMVTGQGAA
jgi:hypothetical protein